MKAVLKEAPDCPDQATRMDLLPPLHVLSRDKTKVLEQSIWRLGGPPPLFYDALFPLLFSRKKETLEFKLGVAWGGVEQREIRRPA